MKKYFVCSDIHSFYDEWMAALEFEGFDYKNKDHCIIVCGDLLDRGTKPIQCLKFANKMYKQGRAILIRGNHEDLLEELFRFGIPQRHDVHNGTWDTVEALAGIDAGDCCDPIKIRTVIGAAKNNKHLQTYLESLVDYAEVGDNIFVHGWIPSTFSALDVFGNPVDNLYDSDWRDSNLWEEARWLNGMKQWLNGIRIPGKTIYCGHWHCSWGNAYIHNDGVEYINPYGETFHIDPETGKQEPHVNYTPFIDEGIVAIDASTACSGFVNCVVVEGDN